MLTDTFSANMETVQPVQTVHTVYSRTIASIQKRRQINRPTALTT